MTGPTPLELAGVLKRRVEDVQVRIPSTVAVREDFHAVRKAASPTGGPALGSERRHRRPRRPVLGGRAGVRCGGDRADGVRVSPGRQPPGTGGSGAAVRGAAPDRDGEYAEPVGRTVAWRRRGTPLTAGRSPLLRRREHRSRGGRPPDLFRQHVETMWRTDTTYCGAGIDAWEHPNVWFRATWSDVRDGSDTGGGSR